MSATTTIFTFQQTIIVSVTVNRLFQIERIEILLIYGDMCRSQQDIDIW